MESIKIPEEGILDLRSTVTPGEAKRNARGKKIAVLSTKKAIVTLKGDEKIDIFEETKK